MSYKILFVTVRCEKCNRESRYTRILTGKAKKGIGQTVKVVCPTCGRNSSAVITKISDKEM